MNGLRYRRGWLARFLDRMAQYFANRGGFRRAIAPSGAAGAGRFLLSRRKPEIEEYRNTQSQ
jgi:hypothetical protein